MKYVTHVRFLRSQLDLAPFAGVFFLLLILLLFHTQFVSIPGVKIDLPAAGDAPIPGTEGPWLMLGVDRLEQFYFDHQTLAEPLLRVRLAEAARRFREPVTLVIYADRTVRYEVIARLTQLAREAGILQVVTATQPPVFDRSAPHAPSP